MGLRVTLEKVASDIIYVGGAKPLTYFYVSWKIYSSSPSWSFVEPHTLRISKIKPVVVSLKLILIQATGNPAIRICTEILDCPDANFVVTGGPGGCQNDNLPCHQWRRLAVLGAETSYDMAYFPLGKYCLGVVTIIRLRDYNRHGHNVQKYPSFVVLVLHSFCTYFQLQWCHMSLTTFRISGNSTVCSTTWSS